MLSVAEPPSPVQDMVNVTAVFPAIKSETAEPDVPDCHGLPPSVIEQESALVEFQEIVVVSLDATELDAAEILAVGEEINTVLLAEAVLPPDPVQLAVNVVVVDRLPEETLEPDKAVENGFPFLVIEQEPASVEVQEMFVEAFGATWLSEAVISTCGPITDTGTLLLTVPPAPVQVAVKVVFAVMIPEFALTLILGENF